jgi:hypothetical protein
MSITSNYELENDAKRMGIRLIGIYPKDKLPSRAAAGCYVINLSDDISASGSSNEGTHWTALYIKTNGHPIYFDSFGFGPPADVQLFLKRLPPTRYSKKQIQNMASGYCGLYSLFFLWFMHKHDHLEHALDQFEKLWSDDVTDNLTKLKGYLKYFLKDKRYDQTG